MFEYAKHNLADDARSRDDIFRSLRRVSLCRVGSFIFKELGHFIDSRGVINCITDSWRVNLFKNNHNYRMVPDLSLKKYFLDLRDSAWPISNDLPDFNPHDICWIFTSFFSSSGPLNTSRVLIECNNTLKTEQELKGRHIDPISILIVEKVDKKDWKILLFF